MSKKPRKVEEQKSSYAEPAAKKGARANPSGVRRAGKDSFRKAADKVFKVHDELLRKLAQ